MLFKLFLVMVVVGNLHATLGSHFKLYFIMGEGE